MKKYKNSLIFKIVIGTSVVMAILFSVLIISNLYSLNLVKSNMINSSMNELKIYAKDIENRLNNGTKDLNEILLHLDDINDLRSDHESTRYFASIKLKDVLLGKITDNISADGYIIYDSAHDSYLSAFSSRIVTRFEIMDFIKQGSSSLDHQVNDLWFPLKINKTEYFMKMYRFSGTFIGALMKADSLMYSIDSASMKSGQFVITDNHGNFLAKKGNVNDMDLRYPLPNQSSVVNKLNKNDIMVTTKLGKEYGRLSYIVKEENVLLGLNKIQWLIVLLGILSLLFMPYVVYFLNREIIRPINDLIEGIHQIEEGNLNYHVGTKGHSKEFKTLSRSFNNMTKEIETLKIHAYEEKLELQRSKLKYLQMQIRPHFFLNAITTVHSLTYKNKNEEIRAFIDALSKHLRYMFKGGLRKVTLREEIEYVKNYICMQEIKFPGSVFYVFDVEQRFENELIPKFLIQTFVENSFKHAMTLEETLSIFVKVELVDPEAGNLLRLVIEDSGEGFPEAVLEEVNKEEVIELRDGDKVGILNIKRTLSLLYEKDHLLRISNVEPSGGRVEILIPMVKGD